MNSYKLTYGLNIDGWFIYDYLMITSLVSSKRNHEYNLSTFILNKVEYVFILLVQYRFKDRDLFFNIHIFTIKCNKTSKIYAFSIQ